jgi:putative SOS response-associated peptidase YedK
MLHIKKELSNAPALARLPVGLMRMWPISTHVNKPENDDPSIIDPIELASDAA